MIRKVHPAQEVNSGSKSSHEDFVGMEREMKTQFQKSVYLKKYRLEPGFVCGEYHKVVRIADIVPGLDPVLHKLIELVHIDIDQKLGGEIAQRQAFPLLVEEKLPITWPRSQRMSRSEIRCSKISKRIA